MLMLITFDLNSAMTWKVTILFVMEMINIALVPLKLKLRLRCSFTTMNDDMMASHSGCKSPRKAELYCHVYP